MPASRWLLGMVLRLAVVTILGATTLGATTLGAATPAAATPPSTPAPRPPGIPTSVSVAAGEASATVAWVAPADDGGDPVYLYTVTANPGGAAVEVPGVARTATVPGLEDGVAYRFTVTARNRAGPGPPSAVSDAVTPRPAPEAAGRQVIGEDFATSAGGLEAVSGGTWGWRAGGTSCRRRPTAAPRCRTRTSRSTARS